MSLRLSVFAAATVASMIAIASPASALEPMRIPDPTLTNPNTGAPDALYDKSIPSTWSNDRQSDGQSSSSSLGGFHFSVSESNNAAPFGPAFNQSSAPLQHSNRPLYPDDPLFQH
jgi:hypothetical protein